MKRISLRDACAVLAVDASTLRRWIARAGIKVIQDEVDKRLYSITQSELRTLARLHGKQIPRTYDVDTAHISDADELESKLTALFESKLAEFDSKLTALQKEVDELKRRMSPQPKILKPPRAEYQAKTPQAPTSSSIPALPDGWVPIADFFEQHGIKESTARRRDEWDYVRTGKWKTEDGRTVKNVLDQEGQAAFLNEFGTQS